VNITTSQWIFQAVASVNTGVDSAVKLVNQASANNVYWVLGTSLNTGVRAKHIGNVFAHTSIVWGSTAAFEGRGFAMTSVSFHDDITAILPYISPTGQPTGQPSTQPSNQPTRQPSGQPSIQPSNQPSTQPSSQPSRRPSTQPSGQPSRKPR
jgi:hypothetical protein